MSWLVCGLLLMKNIGWLSIVWLIGVFVCVLVLCFRCVRKCVMMLV